MCKPFFFAFRLAGDDFEDLMQSADITLLLNLRNGKFLFDNKPPKSYYMTLLWNEQRNRNRDKAKRRAEALDDSARVLQVAASDTLSIDQLEFFLLQIPPLCRALIVIHRILDIDDKYLYKSIIANRQSSEDLEKIMNELAQNIIAKQPLFTQAEIETLLQERGLMRFGKTDIANIRVKRNECNSALFDLIKNQYI